MSSPSTILVRAGAIVALGVATIAGVEARSAGEERPVVESTGAVADAAPAVTTPEVADAVAARLLPATGEAFDPADPSPAALEPVSVVPPVGDPAHLVPIADDAPEPEPVVTTTTAAPPTTTAAPALVVTIAFSATQQYGSCGEAVPYDVFAGTATPGSTVSISSPYGSGSAIADAGGHWTRTVEFPAAPRGETFAVTASGPGGSETFTFTATGEPHA